MIKWLAYQLPLELHLLLAGVFVSNGVNLVNVVYAADVRPVRGGALLGSAALSFAAAGAWTAVAVKLRQLQEADRANRTQSEFHWSAVRSWVTAALVLALTTSAAAVVLLIR